LPGQMSSRFDLPSSILLNFLVKRVLKMGCIRVSL
jgi:hypothetical protein